MKTTRKMIGHIVVTLGIALAAATAQGQRIDEKTLQERIDEICKDYIFVPKLPENARECALEGGLSPEWMTSKLEGMVRKNLPALNKLDVDEHLTDGMSDEYRDALRKVTSPIVMLQKFPGPNTLGLLGECASTKGIDHVVQDRAIDSYVAIEGGDAVPFIRELLAKKMIRIGRFVQRLWSIINYFKEDNRGDDVEKLHAFLLELAQTQQDWFDVSQLDRVLCKTLDDYPQSIQRKQTMQRMQNSETEWNRKQFDAIQAEIDAVPADKRTDLSKRFKLPPSPQQ